MKRQISLLLLALFITGCATSTAPAPESGTETPADAATDAGEQSANDVTDDETPTPTPTPRPSPNDATLALLNQSERAAASGEIGEALSYAERAVRIDPRRADLWTGLARLELANQDPNTAIRYAQKALALAGNRADWQRDAWLVIADAKDALGEPAEATEIRTRWQSVRG